MTNRGERDRIASVRFQLNASRCHRVRNRFTLTGIVIRRRHETPRCGDTKAHEILERGLEGSGGLEGLEIPNLNILN